MGFIINKNKQFNWFMKLYRAYRKIKLESLDVEYYRADEQNNSAEKLEIVEKKNQLRNFPNTITTGSFESWTELKQLWPTGSLEYPTELDQF